MWASRDAAVILGAVVLLLSACSVAHAPAPTGGRFGSDLEFLRRFTDIVVLSSPSGSGQVVVAPGFQGRVMTSTTGGSDAPSFGWIGRAAIQARQRQPHINVFGGEDRFWLGPEGGQYSLYFKAGDPFDLDHWQVPEPIDWGAWEVVDRSTSEVRFRKAMSLANYSNARLELEVERSVRVLSNDDISKFLGRDPGSDVRAVAFESTNTVRNVGPDAWRPESGLPSIWILGMFNPSPSTTIAIPFAAGPETTHGPVVNDAYFGKVPPDRLTTRGSVILFRGDGQYRSKIGLSPSRALSVAGSYDAAGRVLTLVQYSRPENATTYVNSMWEMQREPYKGDVINSYNDGPPAPGAPPLGPFFELETSSPALSLNPGDRYTHVHRTFHLVGSEQPLDAIAKAVLNISLAEIAGAFKQ